MPEKRLARTRKNYEGDNVDFSIVKPIPSQVLKNFISAIDYIDWSKRDPFMQPLDDWFLSNFAYLEKRIEKEKDANNNMP